MSAPAKPIHTEIVESHRLRARLGDYSAQPMPQYGGNGRLVYWGPAQRVWITVERHPQSPVHTVLSLYSTCPCTRNG